MKKLLFFILSMSIIVSAYAKKPMMNVGKMPMKGFNPTMGSRPRPSRSSSRQKIVKALMQGEFIVKVNTDKLLNVFNAFNDTLNLNSKVNSKNKVVDLIYKRLIQSKKMKFDYIIVKGSGSGSAMTVYANGNFDYKELDSVLKENFKENYDKYVRPDKISGYDVYVFTEPMKKKEGLMVKVSKKEMYLIDYKKGMDLKKAIKNVKKEIKASKIIKFKSPKSNNYAQIYFTLNDSQKESPKSLFVNWKVKSVSADIKYKTKEQATQEHQKMAPMMGMVPMMAAGFIGSIDMKLNQKVQQKMITDKDYKSLKNIINFVQNILGFSITVDKETLSFSVPLDLSKKSINQLKAGIDTFKNNMPKLMDLLGAFGRPQRGMPGMGMPGMPGPGMGMPSNPSTNNGFGPGIDMKKLGK